MFFGMSTYGMPSLKVQTYNLLYAKVPHSPEEALKIASEAAKWIFGEPEIEKYPVMRISCQEGRWKIKFISQNNFEHDEIEQGKGIELHLGMNTGKIRHWELKN